MEKLKLGINQFSATVLDLLRRVEKITKQRSFALVVKSEDLNAVESILGSLGVNRVQVETPETQLGKRYRCNDEQVV